MEKIILMFGFDLWISGMEVSALPMRHHHGPIELTLPKHVMLICFHPRIVLEQKAR